MPHAMVKPVSTKLFALRNVMIVESEDEKQHRYRKVWKMKVSQIHNNPISRNKHPRCLIVDPTVFRFPREVVEQPEKKYCPYRNHMKYHT